MLRETAEDIRRRRKPAKRRKTQTAQKLQKAPDDPGGQRKAIEGCGLAVEPAEDAEDAEDADLHNCSVQSVQFSSVQFVSWKADKGLCKMRRMWETRVDHR